MQVKKLFRIAAIPFSLTSLLKGQLHYLNQYFDVYGVASPGVQHEVLHKREGVPSFEINIERRISIWKDLISLFQLYRLFRRETPVIIHSITPKAGFLSMAAGFFAGVPIRIHTFTGLIFPYRKGIMYYLLKNMDRLTCLFATKVIPEGEGVKKDLLLHKVTRKSLKVMANGNVNGIDTSYFSPPKVGDNQKVELKGELGINPGDFVFTFAGRIVGDKGINELVASFKRIQEKYNQCKLLLVGHYEQELDPLKPGTKKIIEEHLAIIVAGWQNDIRPWLAISDCFVFPSYREGFPNTVLQAGAMGLPSIVTDISGSNEIIQKGVNGVIIPSRDEFVLHECMLDLLENREKREQLAANARKMIVDRYEQQYVWGELLKEYQSLV